MRFSTFVSLTVVGLIAAAAQGATITFDANGGSSGDWNVANNWNPNQIPTLADDVVVPSGFTANVTSTVLANDAVANSLDVEGQIVIDDNTLQVDGGGNSTIDSASGILLNDIDATFYLSAGQTFSGTGSIELAHAGALMQLASGVTVTFDVIVEGHGSIAAASGTATLVNQEVVTANSNGNALELFSTLILDDIAAASWNAESGGELQFKRAHTGGDSLVGELYLTGDNSKVTLFGVSMNFDSTFTWDPGTSSTDPTVLFLDYRSANISLSYDTWGGGSCSNPGSGTPYTVNTSGVDLSISCPTP